MHKPLLVLAALSVFVGCADLETQYCNKSAECAGYDDEEIAETCAPDEDKDEPQPTDCDGASDAVLSCVVGNGTCEELGNTGVSVFGLNALADDGPCAGQIEARNECFEDCDNCFGE